MWLEPLHDVVRLGIRGHRSVSRADGARARKVERADSAVLRGHFGAHERHFEYPVAFDSIGALNSCCAY